MLKSFKFRLYPNKTQKQQITQTFGNCRFIYNYYLNKRIELYKNNKESFNYYDCCKDLTNLKKLEDFNWLKLADSHAYQNTLKNLQKVYDKFFKEKSVGFPKFKSKKNNKQSYTTSFINNNILIVDNKHIKLPKIGNIKCILDRQIDGKILSATISKKPSGKYFVSLVCDINIKPKEKTNSIVGIDLGLKEFLITSNGNKINNPRYFKNAEKHLTKLQKDLSRKTIGSSNYNKAKLKLAKQHEKVFNQRNDFLHKLSTQIINENDTICIENLKVKNMIKNHNLSKSISDVSWSKFVSYLEYKANWYDKTIIKVDTFYPSSKTCNVCGFKKDDLTLNIRNWICPICNTYHDRDINAAINILNKGLETIK